MERKSFLIINLNLADFFSLSALFLSCCGLIQILEGHFFLALAFLFLGMLMDTYDGMIARKLGMASEFGRYLDGFIDLVTYLLAPVLFLITLGFKDLCSLIIYFLFLSSGILRLAKFNIIGNRCEGSRLYYTGLPVFWSLFLLVILFAISFFSSRAVSLFANNLSLLIFSILMVLNWPFLKPQRYVLITSLVIGMVGVFFYLQLRFF